jgi:hypothetical protein
MSGAIVTFSIMAVLALNLLGFALCKAAAAGDRQVVDWDAEKWFDVEGSTPGNPKGTDHEERVGVL